MLLRFYKGEEAPLRSAFEKMNRDHLWNKVFPSTGAMTIVEFKRYFRDKWIIALIDGKDDVQTLGWIWDIAGPFGGRRAACGYLAFRELWGTKLLRRAVAKSADQFARLFGLKVMFGLIPEDHRLAVKFAEEVGFIKIAVVPNYIVRQDKLIGGVFVNKVFKRRR